MTGQGHSRPVQGLKPPVASLREKQREAEWEPGETAERAEICLARLAWASLL